MLRAVGIPEKEYEFLNRALAKRSPNTKTTWLETQD